MSLPSRLLAPLFFALACACSSSPKGPVAPSATAQQGVADSNTWMTLTTHGARLRVPPGWKWKVARDEVVAEPPDGTAALVLQGATTKQELEVKLRALGSRYGLDRVDFARAKPGKLNGIDVVMFEDMAAESKGKPVDVFVLLGEAPAGKGVVVLFLYAADATQKHDVELIDAANTLRPI